ncbi:hypothetical protein COX97_00255 [Candidatus Pacearchaeota archaeon CG_4_10_14_0_2_um_filter_05_32_18]|nr:MAG: hypothetical protein COX97_00255 [Candidatus Pacearchaeota archaeon CG_4_10_14_0_2_um_filter_05_32_18]
MVRSVISIILGTIAVLILIKGFFIAVFPKTIKNIASYFTKNYSRLRMWGIIGFIIGGLLLLIAILLKNFNVF